MNMFEFRGSTDIFCLLFIAAIMMKPVVLHQIYPLATKHIAGNIQSASHETAIEICSSDHFNKAECRNMDIMQCYVT